MIHMTSTHATTVGLPGNRARGFGVLCRCGWEADGYLTRGEARVAGDAHLAEANR